MEREFHSLDLDKTVRYMQAYSKAFLNTFNMAAYYGSAEEQVEEIDFPHKFDLAKA